MDFEPSDDQRLLVESIGRMLADNYGFQQRKAFVTAPEGFSTAMWSRYAEQGLLGVPFAEEYGGYGGGPQEVMLVMQTFGKHLVLDARAAGVGAAVLCGFLRAPIWVVMLAAGVVTALVRWLA